VYYTLPVTITVQARLDDETQAALERLVERHGWSASQAVRESIRGMDRQQNKRRTPKLIGTGRYSSALTDLATNPKYMEDFGLDRGKTLKRKKP